VDALASRRASLGSLSGDDVGQADEEDESEIIIPEAVLEAALSQHPVPDLPPQPGASQDRSPGSEAALLPHQIAQSHSGHQLPGHGHLPQEYSDASSVAPPADTFEPTDQSHSLMQLQDDVEMRGQMLTPPSIKIDFAPVIVRSGFEQKSPEFDSLLSPGRGSYNSITVAACVRSARQHLRLTSYL